MRKFIERAIGKLPKLDDEQIRSLIRDLARENEQIEVVLDSMNDGVVVSDVENKLILFNKAAERLVPLSTSDMYERPVWKLIEDAEISGFLRQTLEQEDSVTDREFTLEAGSITRILSCSITPLVRNGHIQGNIFRIVDISEKRGREARLRRAESLASLTTLAAGVAHEIKNPLGSIGIHVQLLEKALKSAENVEQERIKGYLDVVNEEIDRLNRIVVDFLFAVRPMDVKLEDRDPNVVVHELLDFVRYELEHNNIVLNEELEEDLPWVQLDEKYFKQALMNIVKNAISSMPDGGTLTVSTRQRGDEVQLLIVDTGTGMSEEVMAKIFEPYFTTKDFGSGIGLTLVYKVVKEHMGEISVSSQEGRGTTFTITLPVPQRERKLFGWTGEGGTGESSSGEAKEAGEETKEIDAGERE